MKQSLSMQHININTAAKTFNKVDLTPTADNFIHLYLTVCSQPTRRPSRRANVFSCCVVQGRYNCLCTKITVSRLKHFQHVLEPLIPYHSAGVSCLVAMAAGTFWPGRPHQAHVVAGRWAGRSRSLFGLPF